MDALKNWTAGYERVGETHQVRATTARRRGGATRRDATRIDGCVTPSTPTRIATRMATRCAKRGETRDGEAMETDARPMGRTGRSSEDDGATQGRGIDLSSLKDGLTSTARSVADKAGAMFGGKSGEKKEAEAHNMPPTPEWDAQRGEGSRGPAGEKAASYERAGGGGGGAANFGDGGPGG